MASPDSYPGASAPSSSSKSSRFSSFKVFGKFSKEKDSLKPPPPPPPKDPYYMNNRSLVSLQYPQDPIPEAPYSASPHPIGTAYATSGAAMNRPNFQNTPSFASQRPPMNAASSSLSLASSSSLVSSPDIGMSNQQQQQQQQPPPTKSRGSKKAGSIFNFGRKNSKSPSVRSATVDDEMMSLHSNGDDENISTPYNFSHNIHVDEGLKGMPPSWTVSLAKAGFTEDEIAAIYARKQAGTLTPGGDPTSYLHERPRSPAMSIASSAASSSFQRAGTAASSSAGSLGSNVASPVLAHPLPRTTSLPRSQSSDNSLRQTIVGPPARMISPAPSATQQQQTQQQHQFHSRSRNNSSSSTSPLSVSIVAGEGRMRPNVVAVQGDEEATGASVLPEHRRNQSSSSSRQPSRASSLKNRKESPRIQPPPPLASSQQTSPISRPSTPPRRAYFVANNHGSMTQQSPPPAYSAANANSNGIHAPVGPNGYPAEKGGSGLNGAGARGMGHHAQRSTDTSRSGSSKSSQQSPSRSHSTRSPSRHQYSQSSASQQSYGSSSSGSGEEDLRRSTSSAAATTPTNKANKRRSKRVFSGMGGGLNLSLDFGLGADSWSESLMKAIPSASPTQLSFDLDSSDSRRRTPSNASGSTLDREGRSAKDANRDTIKPPPRDYRSVMDRPRPKPPTAVLGAPPRVNVIADDSPVSSASPSTTTFSPTPSVTTFNQPASPLRSPWSFTEGENHLGVEQDERQTFPVSPGLMSDYAASVNSISPRTGLFNEIAGMVGMGLDEEEDYNKEKLSPAVVRSRSGSGSGSGRNGQVEERNHSPAWSEVHSPTLPLSPAVSRAGLHGNGNGVGARGGRGGNRVSAYRIQDRDKMKTTWEAGADEEGDEWTGEDGQIDEEGAEDETLLTIRRDTSNRDSSHSTTSTVSASTVRHMKATTTSVRTAVAKIESAAALSVQGARPKPPSNSTPASRVVPPSAPPSRPPPSQPLADPPISRSKSPVASLKHPASPQDSTFGSEEGSASAGSMSGVSSSEASSRFSGSSVSQLSSTTEDEDEDELVVYYLESHEPGQKVFESHTKLHENHHMITSTSDTFGGVDKEDEVVYGISIAEDEEEDDVLSNNDTISHVTTLSVPPKPTIVISNAPVQPGPITTAMLNSATTPITPAQRYPGWLSEVVKPLEEFIDEQIEPREYYLELQEIAEGESGSVFAARVTDTGNIHKLKLPPLVKARDADDQIRETTTLVAIKCVQIVPSGSTKLDDLRRELVLLRGLNHSNVLTMDALYVDLMEDSLWIRMELMERSLADVVELVESGLVLQERTIARFTSDIAEALQFLRSHNIAHRDVRSDNLLLDSKGFLKLTDFSNALKLPKDSPTAFEPVGVLYWQAPEVRAGPYDALKVDVWSMGATVWEMAQARPPFADSDQPPSNRWPPLDKPQLFSPAFREFLRLCSEPAATRPSPSELLKNQFVQNCCGRPVIVQLLQQCMSIEQTMQANEDNDS
ncbi:hypothetical protein V5O48_006871 [Marasmius crinis-equi]|uniref:Non-specific serine/threonine protein kinase n=1 Tax=Marasmius crinis-equi TaxID=585013 RepID=A0ABR3FI93_9AGAR